MGIFNKLSSKLRQPEELPNSSFPIKLIEPNYGRFVTLKIEEPSPVAAEMYKSYIETYLEGLEQFGTKWSIEGDIVRIECSDEEDAEKLFREVFRK
jgi:hypothetical protein